MEGGRVLELTTSPLSAAAVADVLSPQLIVGRHLLIVDSWLWLPILRYWSGRVVHDFWVETFKWKVIRKVIKHINIEKKNTVIQTIVLMFKWYNPTWQNYQLRQLKEEWDEWKAFLWHKKNSIMEVMNWLSLFLSYLCCSM